MSLIYPYEARLDNSYLEFANQNHHQPPPLEKKDEAQLCLFSILSKWPKDKLTATFVIIDLFHQLLQSKKIPPIAKFTDNDHQSIGFSKFTGTGIFTLLNLGSYEGEFSLGQMKGKGKLTLNNGFLYEGDFEHGAFQGEGTITFDNKTSFQGTFLDNRLYGEVTCIYPTGLKKYVHFSNGKATEIFGEMFLNGWARLIDLNSFFSTKIVTWISSKQQIFIKTEGDFLDEIKGNGVAFYASGSMIEGMFQEGTCSGLGIKTFSGGEKYNGGILNNRLHGYGEMIGGKNSEFESIKGDFFNGLLRQGTIVWRTAYVFEGLFNEGFLESGLIYYPKGSPIISFEGQFRQGLFWKGKAIYTNGAVYEGEFSRTKRFAEGCLIQATGDIYRGVFDEDGGFLKGTLKISDGTNECFYEGEFFDNALSGSGQLFFSNGNYFKGIFRANSFVSGRVKKIFHNHIYEGQWANQKKNGEGCCYLSDDFVQKGIFLDGELISGTLKKSFSETGSYLALIVDKELTKEVFIDSDEERQATELSKSQHQEQIDGLNYVYEKLFFKDFLINKVRKIVFDDGVIYLGEFQKNLPEGRGRLIFSDGRKVFGEFQSILSETFPLKFAENIIYQTAYKCKTLFLILISSEYNQTTECLETLSNETSEDRMSTNTQIVVRRKRVGEMIIREDEAKKACFEEIQNDAP